MAEFVVNTDVLRSEADQLQAVQRELNAVAARLKGIQISSFLRSSSTVVLNRRIRDCRVAVSNQASNLRKLSNGLDSVARLYDRTENNLSEPKTQSGNSLIDRIRDLLEGAAVIVGPGSWHPGIWPPLTVLEIAAVLGSFAGGGSGSSSSGSSGGFPGEWSWISDEVSGSGNLWGIPCSGEAGYSLFGYETDTVREFKWDLEKGNAGIEYGGEISGHILKGEASGNIGILGGKADASLGNVGVSGKINATLFEDGKFTPSLGVEAKAEASALKGSAEGYLGNENYNGHVNASGTLFGAEASASAQVGEVTYKNKQGKTVTAYGVKGEVGAEAYVAEGKVSGGFTFMGIDIDVGVSGKAGGAGVSAGGSVTTGGVHGEIGAGLGLGAGVEISIDWSDFDPPTLEEIGEGIQDVGESIGEGLQEAGDFIEDTGEAIGEGIRNAGEAIGEGFRDAGEAISDFFNW